MDNQIPISEITTGCIGILKNGDKIIFYKLEEDLFFRYLSDHMSLFAYGISKNLVDNDQYIVRIYKPLREYNDVLTAELLWEKSVDWNKVLIDTPIYVCDSKEYDDDRWYTAHFSHYRDGKIFAFDNGKTSFTTNDTAHWQYAKLAEENNGNV